MHISVWALLTTVFPLYGDVISPGSVFLSSDGEEDASGEEDGAGAPAVEAQSLKRKKQPAQRRSTSSATGASDMIHRLLEGSKWMMTGDDVAVSGSRLFVLGEHGGSTVHVFE